MIIRNSSVCCASLGKATNLCISGVLDIKLASVKSSAQFSKVNKVCPEEETLIDSNDHLQR